MSTRSLAQLMVSGASVVANQGSGPTAQRLPLAEAHRHGRLLESSDAVALFEAALSDARQGTLFGVNGASLLQSAQDLGTGVPVRPIGHCERAATYAALGVSPGVSTTVSVGGRASKASPEDEVAVDGDVPPDGDNRSEWQTAAESWADPAGTGMASVLGQLMCSLVLPPEAQAVAQTQAVQDTGTFASGQHRVLSESSLGFQPTTDLFTTATQIKPDGLSITTALTDTLSATPPVADNPKGLLTEASTSLFAEDAASAPDTQRESTLVPIGTSNAWFESTDASIDSVQTGLQPVSAAISVAREGLGGSIAADGLASNMVEESALDTTVAKHGLEAEQQVALADRKGTEGVSAVDRASPAVALAVDQSEHHLPRTRWSLPEAQDAGVDGTPSARVGMLAPEAGAQQTAHGAVGRGAEDSEKGVAQSVRTSVTSADAASESTGSATAVNADTLTPRVHGGAAPDTYPSASSRAASVGSVEAQTHSAQGRDDEVARPRDSVSTSLQPGDVVMQTNNESANRPILHQRTPDLKQRTSKGSSRAIPAEPSRTSAQSERGTRVAGSVTQRVEIAQPDAVTRPAIDALPDEVTSPDATTRPDTVAWLARQATTPGDILDDTVEVARETAVYASEPTADRVRGAANPEAENSLARQTAQLSGHAAPDRIGSTTATTESSIGRAAAHEPRHRSVDRSSRPAETDGLHGRQVDLVGTQASRRGEAAALAETTVKRTIATASGVSELTDPPTANDARSQLEPNPGANRALARAANDSQPDRPAAPIAHGDRRVSLVTTVGVDEAQMGEAALDSRKVSSQRVLDAYETASAGTGTSRRASSDSEAAVSTQQRAGKPSEAETSSSLAPEHISMAAPHTDEAREHYTPIREPMGAVRPRSLIDQVVSNVSYDSIADRSRITIGLEPERLGSIEIQVELENGRVLASIAAETDEARRELKSAADRLASALREQGIDVSEVRIGSMQAAKPDVNDSELRHEFEQGQQRNSGAADQQVSSQANSEQHRHQGYEAFHRPRSLGVWRNYGVEPQAGSSDSFLSGVVGDRMAVQLEYRA